MNAPWQDLKMLIKPLKMNITSNSHSLIFKSSNLKARLLSNCYLRQHVGQFLLNKLIFGQRTFELNSRNEGEINCTKFMGVFEGFEDNFL